MHKSNKKYREAFATGKNRWASTLKRSAQMTNTLGRTSQNKVGRPRKTGEQLLGEAMAKINQEKR